MKRVFLVLLNGLLLANFATAQVSSFNQYGKATQELMADGLTIAHPSLPLFTKINIVNTVSQKEIEVTVIARIPASLDRIADLSRDVWKELALNPNTYIRLYSNTAPRLPPPEIPPPKAEENSQITVQPPGIPADQQLPEWFSTMISDAKAEQEQRLKEFREARETEERRIKELKETIELEERNLKELQKAKELESRETVPPQPVYAPQPQPPAPYQEPPGIRIDPQFPEWFSTVLSDAREEQEQEIKKLKELREARENEERKFKELQNAKELEERKLKEFQSAKEIEERNIKELQNTKEIEDLKLKELQSAKEIEDLKLKELQSAKEIENLKLKELQSAKEIEDLKLKELQNTKEIETRETVPPQPVYAPEPEPQVKTQPPASYQEPPGIRIDPQFPEWFSTVLSDAREEQEQEAKKLKELRETRESEERKLREVQSAKELEELKLKELQNKKELEERETKAPQPAPSTVYILEPEPQAVLPVQPSPPPVYVPEPQPQTILPVQPTSPQVYAPEPMRIIPGLPDPAGNKVYKLQLGAFSSLESANSIAQSAKSIGFDIVLEKYETVYRVLAINVPASMVKFAAQRLAYMGIRQIWVKE